MPSTVRIAVLVALSAVLLQLSGFTVLTLFGLDRKAIYRQWPSTTPVKLSSGAQTALPFNGPDARMLILLGTADVAAVQRHLDAVPGAKPPLYPITVPSTKGDQRVATSIFFTQWRQSVAGPYSEVVVNFACSSDPTDTQLQSVYEYSAAMFSPDVKNYAWRLWLNETLPIDYGRELLGTDKFAGVSEMRFGVDGTTAAGELLTDRWLVNGAPLLRVRLTEPTLWNRLRSLGRLLAVLGPARAMEMALAPHVVSKLVTPPGIIPGSPPDWRPEAITLVSFDMDPAAGIFEFDAARGDVFEAAGDLGAIGFEPQATFFMPKAGMVYFSPALPLDLTSTRR